MSTAGGVATVAVVPGASLYVRARARTTAGTVGRWGAPSRLTVAPAGSVYTVTVAATATAGGFRSAPAHLNITVQH